MSSDAIVISPHSSLANGLQTLANRRGWRVLRTPSMRRVLTELRIAMPLAVFVEMTAGLTDGHAMVRMLCERGRQPRVIVLLAHDDVPRVEPVVRGYGACCCLPLDSSTDEIEQVIEEVVTSLSAGERSTASREPVIGTARQLAG
jgi:ActR/RegA family two-component response regulator